MIGEGNLVQVVTGIVGIERRKAAVAALHPHQPVERTAHAFIVADRIARLMHGPGNHGCIVEVRIEIIRELKCPTAAGQIGFSDAPIAGLIEQLLGLQPVERAGGRLA